MSPERPVQEYEKILQFKSKREAESVLRMLNIFMYGNTVLGEEHHLEIFNGLSIMARPFVVGSGLSKFIRLRIQFLL